MSKQSEAKAKQGFRKESAICSTCAFYTSEIEDVKRWQGDYTIESKLRCGVGGFKVGKTNWCTLHRFKES